MEQLEHSPSPKKGKAEKPKKSTALSSAPVSFDELKVKAKKAVSKLSDDVKTSIEVFWSLPCPDVSDIPTVGEKTREALSQLSFTDIMKKHDGSLFGVSSFFQSLHVKNWKLLSFIVFGWLATQVEGEEEKEDEKEEEEDVGEEEEDEEEEDDA
jgi:hypothetical protein